ncbi:hypothetical protein D9M71_625070 [compost metagenome]
MVEHAHGKHRVEAFQVCGQVFEGERQVPGRKLWQIALHGLELAEKQPVGVYADDTIGAGAEHPPLVIAIAATHIQHVLAAQVQVR